MSFRHVALEGAIEPETDTTVRPTSAATEVYAALRALIIGLKLVPGTVLSRAELAERFGVSQTPVRDALMRLEEERLVDVYPQYATVVAAIDLAMARQAHFLRRAVELEIIETLAQTREDALIADLEVLIRRQEADIQSGDLVDFLAADAALHAHMYLAAGVPDLLTLVQSRSGQIDRLRCLHLMTPGKAQRILDDHITIVEALAAADPTRARAALSKHLSETLSEAANIEARFPDYFTAVPGSAQT
jgi:GntR family transcriptional regulator, rspAB operon transcriptional repressor